MLLEYGADVNNISDMAGSLLAAVMEEANAESKTKPDLTHKSFLEVMISAITKNHTGIASVMLAAGMNFN